MMEKKEEKSTPPHAVSGKVCHSRLINCGPPKINNPGVPMTMVSVVIRSDDN